MNTNRLAERLAEHPKLIGALFALTLLVSQADGAFALSGCGAYHGP